MITEFLYNNFKWNFNQNSMDGLLSLSTTKTIRNAAGKTCEKIFSRKQADKFIRNGISF